MTLNDKNLDAATESMRLFNVSFIKMLLKKETN